MRELSKKYKKEGVAPSCKQEKFKHSKLDKIELYKGFEKSEVNQDWKQLFNLF